MINKIIINLLILRQVSLNLINKETKRGSKQGRKASKKEKN